VKSNDIASISNFVKIGHMFKIDSW